MAHESIANERNPSGDLDDFLRQTAEIRQRKSIHQQAEADVRRQQETRSRSQYTNAKRERQTESSRFDYDETDAEIVDKIDTPILAIEIDPDAPTRLHSRDPKTIEYVHKEHGSYQANDGSPRTNGERSNEAIEGLWAMLRSRQGLRQAFLLREILDRRKF